MKPKVIVIDCGSSKVPDIVFMAEQLEWSAEVVHWSQAKADQLSSAAAIIISGAPILLTESSPTPYLKQLSFLVDLPTPVLGICFGHQVLGLLHDASVHLGSEQRTWQTLQVDPQSVLFKGFDQEVTFAQDHCEFITLPKGFVACAHSPEGTLEGMKHEEKSLFGVQFHPEVSGPAGEQVLKNFLDFSLLLT